ncbi:hypothetical protein Micbo1qcDRAFT_206468 [Microdochium bolleyi]|uniref:Uncharacterized protein n=1 Tax=Microdochium bolleyi TaxID=196109 RepID=A0A136IX99_9PEZI|nr:hypothetical protein Micbo1qcDRAFT_206468 [Microdochium bolleyi]
MRLNNIFTAGAATLAVPALSQSHHCYSSGAAAITGAVYDHAKNACQGWSGNRGALQGLVPRRPATSRRFCVNNLAEAHRVLSSTNENTQQGFDLDDGDCLRNF